VEAADVDVVVVGDEHAERSYVFRVPEAGDFVVAAGEEVVAVRSPADVPDWGVVTAVGDETGPGIA
jgi:hypothetical protein